MAITQKIVREHGGTIQLESEPNRGSCFTIFLPK
ncbi:MAG: ATP-binding protein [Syntrophobacterales bacterium]